MTIASSSSSGFSDIPTIADYGLESGLNTQAIIQAELQPYQAPETNLQNEQSTINSNVSDYQQINADILALQTDATALALPSGWQNQQATSSDSTVATATAQSGTPSGSIQFVVKQLATAGVLVSGGSVASTSQIVDSQPGFLIAAGGAGLGFASLTGGTGLALGNHTLDVTQSSQAAATTGTVDLSSPTGGVTVTTGSNDTLDVTVDGTAYNLTLAASPTGGYSGSGLLAAVQSAITAAGAGGALQAGYDASGNLVLATVDQGSSQTLQVTGGSALATLGLSTMAAASTGVDGVVEFDGTSTTLSTVTPGGSATLTGSSGEQVTAGFVPSSALDQVDSSLLSAGSATVDNVSTGNGSLAAIVANINAADLGVTASAVQTGTNQYVLQLNATQTGSGSTPTVDTQAFASSSLGALRVSSAGQNAEVQVGGSGGYTVQSQTDTLSGLLPGLSVNLVSASANPVTITVSPDANAAASAVANLVSDANTALADIQKYAGYNAQTKTGGPLMGSAVLQTLTNQIQSTIASIAGTSTLGNSQNIGITLSNGTIAFNQTAFTAAYDANPQQVAALFTQGGTFAPANPAYAGQVSLTYAGNGTKTGTYDVQISQSASQASALGSVLASGSVSTAEQLTVAMGSATATYSTTAGQTLAAVAAGLNTAFASAGLQISAQVVDNGQQLQLTSDDYGSAASFTVSSSASGTGTTGLTGTFSGTDVAGTINGVTATGNGQFLTAPPGDATLAGLSLQVTTTGVSSTTDLGSFTYTPGLAQSLATVASAMSDPTSGEITQTIKNMQAQSTGLNTQIQFYASIVSQQQKILMAQYATLEATIGSLKNQSSSLASQLAGLSSS